MDPRRRPAIERALLVGLLVACRSSAGEGAAGTADGEEWRCSDHAPSAAACDIGTGESAFQGLVDGDPLPVYRGVQGALHVFGSLRCTAVKPGNLDDLADPDNPVVSFSVIGPDAWLGGYHSLPRPLTPVDGDTAELVGDVLPLDIDSFDAMPVEPVLFSFELDDACGAHVAGDVAVMLVEG